MNVADMAEECALMIADPAYEQITRDQWMLFIRRASRDLHTHGWLRRANDDSSLVAVANTYTYAIPQDFAYITELRGEDLTGAATSVFTRLIPPHHWTIRMQGGVPVILFYTISSLEVGRKIQIVGQKRPSTYATLADLIDLGMESVLSERALAYGARSAAAGTSELAKWRQVVAGQAMAASEAMMRMMPQEFRQMNSAIVVPGREA